MRQPTRRTMLGLLGTVGFAGCLGSDYRRSRAGAELDQQTEPITCCDASERDPTNDFFRTAGTDEGAPPLAETPVVVPDEPSVLSDQYVSGGVGQDGIPSIDRPQYQSAENADVHLDAGDPVFGVEINGDVRAFPQSILVWHEIVNAVIGGEPVTVTYCPLTGTAQGFLRGDNEFGVSGNLLNSNLVMYDRETNSYWPQMLARGITGDHIGDTLQEFSVTWTTWECWRSTYPDTEVLTEDTGYVRDYNRDPYGGYNPASGFYADESIMFQPYSEIDEDRFHVKEVVLGARTDEIALAVHKDSLAASGLLTATIQGDSFVAIYDPSLHTGYMYKNPDDTPITYVDGNGVIEGDTYRPDQLPFERIIRYDAMWYAWNGYYPDTVILE